MQRIHDIRQMTLPRRCQTRFRPYMAVPRRRGRGRRGRRRQRRRRGRRRGCEVPVFRAPGSAGFVPPPRRLPGHHTRIRFDRSSAAAARLLPVLGSKTELTRLSLCGEHASDVRTTTAAAASTATAAAASTTTVAAPSSTATSSATAATTTAGTPPASPHPMLLPVLLNRKGG